MKTWHLFAAALLVSVGAALAADRKDVSKISSNDLRRETQRAASPAPGAPTVGEGKGLNLVWYVPQEFWETTLRSNPNVPKESADQMLAQMKHIFIVAVVRAQIHDSGNTEFYDEGIVKENLSVKYVDATGKETELKPTDEINPATTQILNVTKNIMKGAMGNMGKNMHFFIYSDETEKGDRVVSPDKLGKLAVKLTALEGEPGGNADIAFPLNALFEERACPNCHHEKMDIKWTFCPYCGKPLPE